ncbi:MAG: phosphoglucosamine mutase [Thermodesulfovibrionales bacterium]
MRLFGTDGIRGKVNEHPMTPENVLKIGMAAASVLSRRHGRNMILIGKDTRLSGYMIESALTSGICSMGMNVTLTGPIPTPGIAFLTRALRQDAGIVISASHNPFEDNGIKFFSSNGFKLPDELEERIERIVFGEEKLEKRPSGCDIGKAFRLDDATGRYIEYIKSTIPRGSTLEGLKVVVDCANGAAYKVTPWVLRELGAEVVAINDRPDGININDSCGSLHMEALCKAVKDNNAHIGIAHDGDADRTLFCDEKGDVVDGDKVLGLWAVQLKKEGRLRNNAVVATVMSNSGLEAFLSGEGIKVIRTKVGDRFVAERMIDGDYILGGEPSGHIICLDYNTTGDGPITALQMLHTMWREGKPLSELVKGIETYPQVLINVPVKEKVDLNSFPGIMKSIREVERSLKNKGRVLVRLSGTENKIRVMVEAIDRGIAESSAQSIASVIKEAIG